MSTTLEAASRPAARGRATYHAVRLERALAPIKEELEAVTERVLFHLQDPVVRKVMYLVTAGGKRLRPALVLLAGTAGGTDPGPPIMRAGAGNREALIDAATAVELIHTSTLIHDDIIDQSALRRAQPTFHHRWGTERAVLMGDYLYTTAFSLLARLQLPYVTQVMSEVCRQLCRGELREVDARYRLNLREEEYVDIIRDKTASLIGGCCDIGAYLAGCPSERVERLRMFGLHFGVAFQIIDDCLDLTGDQRELGKSILTDLDKGALSLPIIYLTQTLSCRERQRLFAPLRRQARDPAFLARVARAADAHGAIAKAEQRALEYVELARQALAEISVDGLTQTCQQLADYVVGRRS